jgi:hypothetical protein
MNATNKIVTVQDMINSLMQFPMDAPVEISITQYNKRYPVAYVQPSETHFSTGADVKYADMLNGKHVRITASLPVSHTDNTYMMTSVKKIK